MVPFAINLATLAAHLRLTIFLLALSGGDVNLHICDRSHEQLEAWPQLVIDFMGKE